MSVQCCNFAAMCFYFFSFKPTKIFRPDYFWCRVSYLFCYYFVRSFSSAEALKLEMKKRSPKLVSVFPLNTVGRLAI